ncbi:MAG TPA: copper transporter [Mycobacteriales bacterium]|nr:copper transporter [Mycobacteriales bacterium]
MIDFRYHIVSLVAVFLALALGVLLGTTQLNGAVLDDLRGQVRGLTDDKRDLQSDLQALRGQTRSDDAVAASLTPKLVAGALRDAKVVLVATAQASGATTDGVQKVLERAGARVTGRVQLTDDYSDPRRAADVKSFVTGGGQPAGFQLPESDDAGVLSGALLSYALLGSKSGDPEPATTSEVLSGFASLQMLRVDSPQVGAADLAVVVASGRVTGADPQARVRTLSELVSALDRAGRGALVAGTSAAAATDGLVAAVRADRGLSSAVSTVDDADRPVGQVAAVFALAQQSAGRTGQYGTASGADAAFPPTSSS